MSQKWRRSRAWDDQFFPRWAWPAKATLRAFSSIWLAVIMLSIVATYGILASIPLGMIALIPTKLTYAGVYVLTLVLLAALPILVILYAAKHAGVSRAGRFVILLLGGMLLATGASFFFGYAVWPRLRYDETTGRGLRFFAEFAAQNDRITIRRLPIFEMTELEFYSWWPLRVILLLFVANMVTATVRRIEFTFKNLGVLMVHTGIVVITLGSVHYGNHKREGDMLLLAGPPNERGVPGLGQPNGIFFDNTKVALYLRQGSSWEPRLLNRLPRYNDHGLSALGVGGEFANDNNRTLLLEPPPIYVDHAGQRLRLIDKDLEFRVVAFAAYAELDSTWVRAPAAGAGETARPVIPVRLEATAELIGETPPAMELALAPLSPKDRVFFSEQFVAIEATRGMPESRWTDLTRAMPGNAAHAIIVEIPGRNYGAVLPAVPGARLTLGDTGYTIDIEQIEAEPPFPIITPGFEGATSSIAVVRITPPAELTEDELASGLEPRRPMQRWIYHRFSELTQDVKFPAASGSADAPTTPTAAPMRSAPNPSISVRYLDSRVVQLYIDQKPSQQSDDDIARFRVLLRWPGQQARVFENVRPNDPIPVVPGVAMRVGQPWNHSISVEAPVCVEPRQQDSQSVGKYLNSIVGVEVTSNKPELAGWMTIVWLPFSQYLDQIIAGHREITIPDGRRVTLAFSRWRHRIPGITMALKSFEMIPYPHSDTPRDYKSDLLIERDLGTGRIERFEASTSLNHPLKLRASYESAGAVPAILQPVRWIADFIAPNTFKFSQAGWDQSGWRQTQADTNAGLRERPAARFTILGVGNNPGIYIIAAGSVLMSIGIPWAFYLKPYLVRRERDRIRRTIAEEQRKKQLNAAESSRTGQQQNNSEPAQAQQTNGKPIGQQTNGHVTPTPDTNTDNQPQPAHHRPGAQD